MNMQTVKIKKLTATAKIPTRGSAAAAGYDIYADVQHLIHIPPHSTVKIETGIAIALPNDTFGAIYPRSGLATREGLRLSNSVAVIDPDYRGEILVPLFNDSEYERVVEPGERIAQLVVQPFVEIDFFESPNLDATERGNGGFGSTGMN